MTWIDRETVATSAPPTVTLMTTSYGPGAVVRGPAIVEAPLTTIVVPPGYQGAVDGYRNVIIT